MALITKLSTCVIGENAVISTEGSSTSGTGRYSIEYEFGDLTGVIKDNMLFSSVPATITWKIPAAFAKEIPYATSKTGKLISYYTYAGKKEVNYTSTFVAKIADNAVPTIDSTVATTDAISSQLSGNTSTIINGVSTVQINLYATPTTGAYIKDKWCQNPPNYYSGKHGTTQTFIGHNNGVFKFGATDTRNRSATKTITLAAIDYKSPTISIDGVDINTSGVATIDISGTWFKGSFGKVSNDITVSYRYKSNSSSSWGSWTTIPNAAKNNDGTFSATVTKSGLSYTETYNFEARVQDAINIVSSKEYIAKSLPVFDWSADDFNFNVPVSVLAPTQDSNPATKKYVDTATANLATKNYVDTATTNLATKSYAKSQRPSVNGKKSAVKILMGTETMQFDSYAGTNKTITFSTPFTSRPMVIAGQAFNSANVLVYSEDVTTTGFTLTIAPVGSNGTRDIDWIAIGV